MNAEQGKNVLNAFIEVREKLEGMKEVHMALVQNQQQMTALMSSIMTVLVIILILTIVAVVLQIAWIIIKVKLDQNQERRFKALTDVAAGHGFYTDRAKSQIVTEGLQITEAASVAANRASAATTKVEEAGTRMATELHAVKAYVEALARHLCPEGVPGLKQVSGKEDRP
jgi:hypothetical protein